MHLLSESRRLRDFPLLKRLVYLNSAAVGPCPEPVLAAGASFVEGKNRRNPESLEAWLDFMETVRIQVARLIGARPHEIAFTPSTADGMNLVARGFGKLKRGDTVILDDLDYPTNVLLWNDLFRTRGTKVITLRSEKGAVPPERFSEVLDGRTRLVSLAMVSHYNGFVHDVAAISRRVHRAGGFMLVDAVQAVGGMEIDVRKMGIDFLACGAYKWLLGPLGLGFVYIREDLLDHVEPAYRGWMQIEKTSRRTLDGARRFEYATMHFQGFYEFSAALAYLQRVGVRRIAQHNRILGEQLQRGLRERGIAVLTPPGNPHGITAFSAGDGLALTRRLFRKGIGVQGRRRNVRVAPHFYNTPVDIERFFACLDRLAPAR